MPLAKYRLIEKDPPCTFIAFSGFKIKADEEVEAFSDDPRIQVLLEEGHIEEVKERPKKKKQPKEKTEEK